MTFRSFVLRWLLLYLLVPIYWATYSETLFYFSLLGYKIWQFETIPGVIKERTSLRCFYANKSFDATLPWDPVFLGWSLEMGEMVKMATTFVKYKILRLVSF